MLRLEVFRGANTQGAGTPKLPTVNYAVYIICLHLQVFAARSRAAASRTCFRERFSYAWLYQPWYLRAAGCHFPPPARRYLRALWILRYLRKRRASRAARKV
jgi:hypothetical protein